MSEKFEGGVPPQGRKQETQEIFGKEYPDRRSAASAIAGSIANEDPEYKRLNDQINKYEEFTKGAREARDERELDEWRSKRGKRWRDVYNKAMAVVEKVMEEVSDEYQKGQLKIEEGHVDHEETRKYWKASNALEIVWKRTQDRLNSATE